LLISVLTGFAFLLTRAGSPVTRLTVPALAIKNAARRKTRNIAVAALIAVGVFAATAVGSNRVTVDTLTGGARSGTGGFDLIVETAVPLEGGLSGIGAGEQYRYPLPEGSSVTAFRAGSGDDASCLNLNRVPRPRLLGVDPATLSGSFSAAEFAPDYQDFTDPWDVLASPRADGLIPAVADSTVIQWSLGKAVGDIIEYTDESGKTFEVILAAGLKNSIFQGNIIIAEDVFLDRYPSIGGYRFFLLDLSHGGETMVPEMLDSRLADSGAEIRGTRARLAEFYSVQNSYLAIFMTLGWIGVLLGTIGLGIAVYRNVYDSRDEWAVMSAVGYNGKLIRKTARIEHLLPAIAGIVAGSVSAIAAAGPAAGGSGISWLGLAGLTGLLAVSAVAFIFVAVSLALPRRPTAPLRSE
jgi:hypothetical protein